MTTLLPEDLAMDTLWAASGGCFVMPLVPGLLTAPSWPTFTSLAGGWALARDRHPITTDLWLTGATAVKHVARCSVCRGGPRADRRWPLWGSVIRRAAHVVPDDEVLRVSCAD